MKYFYIDDYNLLNNDFSKFNEKKDFIITSTFRIKLFLVKEKFTSFYYLGDSLNSNKKNKLKIFYFKEIQKLLIFLDNYKNIKKKLINSNINIFYNSFRYRLASELTAYLSILYSLKNFLHIYKIKKITFYGNFGFNLIDPKVFLVDLNYRLKKIKIVKFDSKKIIKLESSLKAKLLNLKFFQIIYFLKKLLSNIIPLKFKKNLVLEPLFDFFYSSYSIKKNYFIKFDDFQFSYNNNNSNKKDYNKFLKPINKKFKDLFSFEVIDFIIQNGFVIDHMTHEISLKLNKMSLKSKFENLIWCCDPNELSANLISLAKNKKINIYGIQHGGSYSLQNYELLNYYSDFSLCDKYLSYGFSKKLKRKKLMDVGSFKSSYFKKRLINYKSECEVMFIPTAMVEDFYYFNQLDQHKKYQLQMQISKISFENENMSILKIPEKYDLNHFPIIDKIKSLYPRTKIVKNTVYESIFKYRPKIVIIDCLSTSIYECLYFPVEIVLFVDKFNIPQSDILKKLKKRIHIVKNLNEFKKILMKINKTNNLKINNEFLNEFFLLRDNKDTNFIKNSLIN